MRKISFVQLCLSVLILFSTFACEKNDVISSKETTTQSDYVTSDGIPVFATQEEFDTELNKVKSMALEELKAYEDKKGYKSFGRISDDFYARIDPTQFKSKDDVIAFVKANSKYLQLYKASDGELYCETQDFQNGKRYLMNEQKMYIIGKKLYKDSEEKVEQQGMQKATSGIHEAQFDKYTEGSIFSDTYRVHVWVSVGTIIGSSVGLPNNGYNVEMRIKNYSRSLGIWWWLEMKTTYAPFEMSIVAGNNTLSHMYRNNDPYHVVQGSYIDTFSHWEDNIFQYYLSSREDLYAPYFQSFSGTVTSTYTKKTGRTVTMTVDLQYPF